MNMRESDAWLGWPLHTAGAQSTEAASASHSLTSLAVVLTGERVARAVHLLVEQRRRHQQPRARREPECHACCGPPCERPARPRRLRAAPRVPYARRSTSTARRGRAPARPRAQGDSQKVRGAARHVAHSAGADIMALRVGAAPGSEPRGTRVHGEGNRCGEAGFCHAHGLARGSNDDRRNVNRALSEN